MEQTVKDYGRYLHLQLRLPALAQAKEETRRAALAAGRERSMKQWEWKRLSEPGFFLRLLGNAARKQDAAYLAFQEAEREYRSACHASEQASEAHRQVREALEMLAEAPERYDRLEKTPALAELALENLRPAAQTAAQMCLTALEEGAIRAREEMQGPKLDQEDGSLNYLAQARTAAKQLRHILEQFPEPEGWLCDYLLAPDGYLMGAATKFSRMDRLNSAIGQLRKLRSRLN